MPTSYFQRLHATTATRLWINNPTTEETHWALAQGAVSCTTNPTFGANLIRREPAIALPIVDACCADHAGADAAEVADHVQQRLAQRLLTAFAPVHAASDGRDGWVSIQGNPHADGDADGIIGEARRYRQLGPNFIAKIPAIPSGLAAIETLLAEGVPVIATEMFSLAQTRSMVDLVRRVTRDTGRAPVCYLTHITGIYDDYLQAVVKRDGITLDPGILAKAGRIVCRAVYRYLKDAQYPGILLGGGARQAYHFSDLVGGDMHITINWSTAAELLETAPPINDSIAEPTDERVLAELHDKLPDFRRAYDPDGLHEEEYAEFGPVQHFHNQFICGWDELVQTVSSRRPSAATPQTKERRP